MAKNFKMFSSKQKYVSLSAVKEREFQKIKAGYYGELQFRQFVEASPLMTANCQLIFDWTLATNQQT